MREDARFWDRAARKYAASPIRNAKAYEATLDRVRSHLSPEDTVLEIGCGTGTTALKLAGAVSRYVGTDISAQMIEIAREKLAEGPVDGLDFRQAPAEADGFEAGSFDAVLGFNILHLVPDLGRSAARAHDLLRPGGLFITKTPCLRRMGWYLRPAIWAMQLVGKAPHVLWLGRGDVEAAIGRAGFEIVEARAFEGAPNSWFVVARKPA